MCDGVGLKHTGDDDNDSSQGGKHHGADEYRHDCQLSLLNRMINSCLCMSVRCRTKTCLVVEKASCNTKLNSFLYCDTEGTAGYCSRIESAYKDHLQGIRDCRKVCNNDDQSTDEVEDSHDGNQLLSYGTDTGYAAGKDDQCKCCDHDTACQLIVGNMLSHELEACSYICKECRMECITDGVCLYCVTEKSQSQSDQNCEDTSQYLTEGTLVSFTDVVHRSADVASVGKLLSGSLSQNCLAEDGSHTKECGYPHPEYCTRAAGCDSRSNTGDVTGTYLTCDCSGNSLE